MHIDVGLLGSITRLGPCESPDGTVPEIVPVSGIYAPVSGSLILGTVAGELECLQHLKAVQHISGADPVGDHFDCVRATILANTYRLFGHDTIWYDDISGEEVYPWATAKECIVEPASLDTGLSRRKALMIRSSVLREGRNHVLPNVLTMLRAGGADVVIQSPTIKMTHYGSRTKELRPSASRLKAAKEVKFLVKAPLVFDPVTFEARPITVAPAQSFQRAMHEVPALKPEGQRAAAPTTDVVDIPLATAPAAHSAE
jgi:hypothetical protein